MDATATGSDRRTVDDVIGERIVIAAKLCAGGCLTVHEAAIYLAVHAETIRRALRRGTLKGVRPQGLGEWRIVPADLAAYIGVPLAHLAREGGATPGNLFKPGTVKGHQSR